MLKEQNRSPDCDKRDHDGNSRHSVLKNQLQNPTKDYKFESRIQHYYTFLNSSGLNQKSNSYKYVPLRKERVSNIALRSKPLWSKPR
jgi:hypothetical protein